MNWVVVDTSFLAYQAMHTMGKLSHGDEATGIIFGFLTRVLTLGEKFGTNKFVFAFDTPADKGVRRKAWPDYKINRGKDDTPAEKQAKRDLHKQLDTLREKILPSIGFKNVYQQMGFESDDIIGWLTKQPDGQETTGIEVVLFDCSGSYGTVVPDQAPGGAAFLRKKVGDTVKFEHQDSVILSHYAYDRALQGMKQLEIAQARKLAIAAAKSDSEIPMGTRNPRSSP